MKKTAEFVHSLGEKDGVVLLRGLMDTIDQQRAGRTPAAGEKIQIDFVMKPREALAADYHGRDPLITRRKTFGTFLALGVGATTYGFISQANHKSQANALTLQALGMSPKTEAPVVVKTEETIADFGPNAVVAKSTPQGRELVPADVERQKILEAGRAKRAAADDRWNVGAGGAGTVVVLGTSVALKKLWRYLKSPDQENADKSTSGLQKLLNTAGYRSDDVELRALTTAVSTGTPSR